MTLHIKKHIGKVLTSFLKSLLLFFCVVAGLVILAMALFNHTPVQDTISRRIENELQHKVGIRLEIGKIRIFRDLFLQDLLVRDADGDTLVYIGQLRTGIGLLQLADRSLEIKMIRIGDSKLTVRRPVNPGEYNFQFIADSLASSGDDAARSSRWDVNIRRVILDGFHVAYDDRVKNISAALAIGRLDCRMDGIDVEKMLFDLGSLSLKDGKISYSDQVAASAVKTTIGDLTVRDGHLAVEDHFIKASELALGGSHFSYVKNPANQRYEAAGDTAIHPGTQTPNALATDWKIRLEKLELTGNAVSYHQNDRPPANNGLDPGHLDLERVNILAQDIRVDTILAASISNAELREKDGLSIDRLRGTLLLSSRDIRINDFELQTPRTILSTDGLLLRNPGDPDAMEAELNLDGSLYTGDLLYGIPTLYGRLPDGRDVDIHATLTRKDQTITIEKLDISMNDAAIEGYGSVRGWEDPDSMITDSIHIQLVTDNDLLASFLPLDAIAGNINLPPDVSLTLNMNGSLNDLAGNVALNTGLGDFHAHIKSDSVTRGKPIHLTGEMHLGNVNLKELLGNHDLGMLAADFTFSLHGDDLQNIAGQAAGMIEKLDYAGYAYRDLNVTAGYDRPDLSASLFVKQPEIAFRFNGEAELAGGLRSGSFRMNLEKADFGRLRIGPRDFWARGLIEADIQALRKDSLEGELSISKAVIGRGDERHEIGPIRVVSTNRDSSSAIHMVSDFLEFSLSGNIPPLEIPSVAPLLAARLPFPGPGMAGTAGRDTLYRLHFELILRDDQVLTDVLIPGLKQLDISKLEGRIDGYSDTAFLDADIAAFRYGAYHLRSVYANLDAGRDHFSGRLQLDALGLDDMTVSNVLLEVMAREEGNRLRFEIPWSDTSFLQIVADLYLDQDQPYIRLLTDSLILNGRKWQVNPENRLNLTPPYLAEHIVLRDQEKLIRILSRDEGETGAATLLEIRDFDLSSLQPLAAKFARTLTGRISGSLSVEGSMAQPAVQGELVLEDIEVFPNALNTWLYVDDETIEFHGDAIRFTEFQIKDADRNPATLNGTLHVDAVPEMTLDLSFTAKDFLAINTQKPGFGVFHGKVVMDSDTDIKGTPSALEINSNTVLLDGTNVKVIVPERKDDVLSRTGIVKFVDREGDTIPLQPLSDTGSGAPTRNREGLDLRASLGIAENSRLDILIDPDNGDRLSLEGEGNLSFRLRPGGDVNLSGRYEINDGRYNLNFQQLANREFRILDGSYLLWTGKPTDANLNIKARHSIETRSPIPDLSTRLPFHIDIQIGGKLMRPELRYSLSMPPAARQQYGQVDAYIRGINRDETELNKQVMSLILFNSFMPGQRGSGPQALEMSEAARSSLSRFITEQLNRLSPGIEGLDVTVGIESHQLQTGDDLSDAVTNLEVGLSQALFNERLRIMVSGDVYLENNDRESQEVLEYLDDVMVEYELSEDGDLHLVGFRKSDFDELSQGNYTKTGIGVIFIKKFDKLKELFGNRKPENAQVK